MIEQYDVVTGTLKKLGLADKWREVEPVRGGLRGNVWIQDAVERLDAYVELSPQDAQFLGETAMVKRVQVAIEKAMKG